MAKTTFRGRRIAREMKAEARARKLSGLRQTKQALGFRLRAQQARRGA